MLYSGEALEKKAPWGIFCRLYVSSGHSSSSCVYSPLPFKGSEGKIEPATRHFEILEKKPFFTRTLSNIFSARKIEECLAGNLAKEHLQPLDAISYDSSTVAPRSPCFLQPSS